MPPLSNPPVNRLGEGISTQGGGRRWLTGCLSLAEAKQNRRWRLLELAQSKTPPVLAYSKEKKSERSTVRQSPFLEEKKEFHGSSHSHIRGEKKHCSDQPSGSLLCTHALDQTRVDLAGTPSSAQTDRQEWKERGKHSRNRSDPNQARGLCFVSMGDWILSLSLGRER